MAAPSALVIDDNPLNLELVLFLLEADGFVVSTAANAEEAMESLGQAIPDVLVVDVQLPGISGLDLITRLRKDPRYDGVCIVVVTSYAMDSDREAAFRCGCNGYLTKPIDTRTFTSHVRRIASIV